MPTFVFRKIGSDRRENFGQIPNFTCMFFYFNGFISSCNFLPSVCLSRRFSRNCLFSGTVFSSKYLDTEKNAKKFAQVFAKRLAYSAVPRDCTDCECTSLQNGLSYIECTPCTYLRSNVESHVSTVKLNT